MPYRGLLVSLILCIFSLSNPVFSQDLAKEQQKLLSSQQSIIDIQNEQNKLEKALSTEKSNISKLETDLAPLTRATNEARSALNQATATAVASPTTENSARVKNAEFKLMLAERKYNKSSGGLQKALKTVEKLESDHKANLKKIEQTNKEISEQQKRIIWLENNQKKIALQEAEKLKQAELKRQEDELIQSKIALAESQAEQAAAEREITRLKSMLLEKSESTSNGSALAGAAAVSGVVIAGSSASSASAATAGAISAAPASPTTPEPAISTGENTTDKPTEITSPASSAAALEIAAEGDSTTAKLTPEQTKALAKEEHAAFALRISQLSRKEKRSTPDKILHLKPADNEGKTQSYSMPYIGKKLYRAEITLNAGKQIFKLGQREWDITVAKTDDNTAYLINYDALDKNQPRLIIYKKSDIE